MGYPVSGSCIVYVGTLGVNAVSLSTTEQPFVSQVIPWGAIPGPSVTIVGDFFVSGSSAVVIATGSLRLGATDVKTDGHTTIDANQTARGNVIATTLISSRGFVHLENTPVVKPTGSSYVQLTFSGSTTHDIHAGSVYLVTPTLSQSVVLSAPWHDSIDATSERTFAQWPVDFDRFASSTVLITLAGKTFQGGTTATYRVRVGGTDNVLNAVGTDGTLVCTMVRTTDLQSDGVVNSVFGYLANPGGVRFVKLSAFTDAGTVVIREYTIVITGV